MKILAEISLSDLDETLEFAQNFAPVLRVGDVVALDGTLGAGKTEFCRAVILSLGLSDDVPSPTFNLVQTYDPTPDDMKTPPIWHMDMYRLESPEEAFELGIEEAFEMAVSLIEWPSKLGPYLPDNFLTLRIEIPEGENTKEMRKLTIIGDEIWQKRLEALLPYE